MKKIIRRLVHNMGFKTDGEYQLLKDELSKWQTEFFPPGHYYSPLNDIGHLKAENEDFFRYDVSIKDVDLRIENQLHFLEQIKLHYKLLPFTSEKNSSFRYHYDNGFFSYSDGVLLFCILLHLRPKRVVEIGSGYSSALMLDTNEHFIDNNINLTFIEPYPEERLLGLLKPNDEATVIKDFVQNVKLDEFRQLGAGDILFVDSSHVSKFKSDLNYILFNVLPELASGVYIHFHDIFFPFEYPKEWILSGRAWNEIYLLRAFLMNNNKYEIVLFPSMIEQMQTDWFKVNMPLATTPHAKWADKNGAQTFLPTLGQSFWIKKK